MFLRLLIESFLRQKRRKALAGIAILLGTTAVTAMLALATTIGDRIHRELAVYGANIVVTPKAADLAVNIGGVDVKPATGGVYLHESDLAKLQTIFWHNNITGISPEFSLPSQMAHLSTYSEKAVLFPSVLLDAPLPGGVSVNRVGLWFDHPFGTGTTGAPALHPSWKVQGRWPSEKGAVLNGNAFEEEVVVGSKVAKRFDLLTDDSILLSTEHIGHIVGIVTAGDAADNEVLYALDAIPPLMHSVAGKPFSPELTRIDVSARTRPEDAFARKDPDLLPAKQRDLWYCRPYANSIAYQIREAIPGADAQQVRRVEQSEGTVLSRISGLMWLVSAAALLAAGFAVSAAMATAVLERRGEIGLMRSLGAGKAAIAGLFYAESSLLATVAGLAGYVAGSALAWALGRHIFPADGPTPLFNAVLLPVIVALAVLVAIAGSTPAIRSGLSAEVSGVLRGND